MGPLLPASAELAVRTDTPKLKELYLRGTKYIALIAAPAAAFLVVMAPTIMRLWLGEASHAYAELALQLLAIAYFFNILTGAVNSIGRGIGVLTYELQATGLMTVLNLGLSLSLVILFGYAGALIGTAVAMTIGNLVYLWRFNRFMGTAAGQLLATALSKPLGCACLAGALIYGLHRFLIDSVHWIGFSRLELAAYVGGAGVVFLAIFASVLWMTKFFNRADAETFHQLLAAVRAA
jgi:O-antigen/teichoic acid export membrane protein